MNKQQRPNKWHRELYSIPLTTYNGRESEKEYTYSLDIHVYTHIYVYSTSETNTTLWVNYTSIKNKKIS